MRTAEFFDQLSQGKLNRLYLLDGEEAYLQDVAVQRLSDRAVDMLPEINVQRFSENAGADEICHALSTLPCMSERRFILVRDFEPLMKKKKAKEDEGKNARDDKSVQQVMDQLTDSACLVFLCRGNAESSSPWTKAIGKQGTAVRFAAVDEAGAWPWMSLMAKNYAVLLDQDTAAYLFTYVGGGLTSVDGEMSKLASFVGRGNRITPDAIRAICIPSVESRVFGMIQSLWAGKSGEGLHMLRKLLEDGESPSMILSVLEGQLRAYRWATEIPRSGMSMEEAAKALMAKDFVLQQAQRKRGMLSTAELEDVIASCAEADTGFKQGRYKEQDCVEMVVMKLANMVHKS